MFQIIDTKNNFLPVKSGFKTLGQALKWAEKNLEPDSCPSWGKMEYEPRYFIKMH